MVSPLWYIETAVQQPCHGWCLLDFAVLGQAWSDSLLGIALNSNHEALLRLYAVTLVTTRRDRLVCFHSGW